jgi:hypothetical protein
MIDSYDFGRIIIDGRKFASDVVIFQDRINGNWWRKQGHLLSVDDVKEIVDTKPEVLVVGTGYSGFMKIHPQTEKYLRSIGIELIAAKTEKACKIYNDLSKSRRAVAAFHLMPFQRVADHVSELSCFSHLPHPGSRWSQCNCMGLLDLVMLC